MGLSRFAILLGVFVLVGALAACGGGTTPAASPSAAFTSHGFGYAISYDPQQFSAHLDAGASGSDVEWTLPGFGPVRGATQTLMVTLKEPADQPESVRGEVSVLAVKPVHVPRTPTLAEFSSEPYMRKLKAAGYLTEPPQTVSLNGLPAFRYELHFEGVTTVTYELLYGSFAYQVNLGAPTNRWDTVAPELDAVAHTFAAGQ